MKKKLFIAGLFFLFAAVAFADRAGYHITNYSFKGTYNSDNTVTCYEKIDVMFTEPRHGIYQSFNDDFWLNVSGEVGDNSDVRQYYCQVKDLRAAGDPFTVTHEDGLYTIRIGDPNSYVSGSHSYYIYYTYVFPDDRYDKADFIYFSVLPDQWNVSIDHFDFELSFAEGFPAVSDFSIFSGRWGGYGNDLDIIAQKEGDTIFGEADYIEPNNAITLFSRLYEGYFTNERTSHNPLPVWIIWGLTIAFILYQIFLILRTKHKSIIPTVEFYPPDGISSAEVGTIIDNSADEKDIISLVPWFAYHGYISILQTDATVSVKKLNDLPQDAPLYQKDFFNAMFCEGNEMSFDAPPDNFYDKYQASLRHLKSIFGGEKELYQNKSKAIGGMVLNTLIASLFMLDNSAVYRFHNLFDWVPVLISFLLGIGMMIANDKKTFFKGKFVFRMLFFVLLTGITAGVSIGNMWSREFIVSKSITFATMILSMLVNVFAFRRITKTDWNLEISGKLIGLKQFIKTAEIDQLKMLVDENPEYFYKVLPYAMVFGLTDKWTDLFKDIDMAKPKWYRDESTINTNYHFGPAMMISSINLMNQGVSAEITKHTASSSKSFSMGGGGGGFSGGFSGGGGAGGGGGSW